MERLVRYVTETRNIYMSERRATQSFQEVCYFQWGCRRTQPNTVHYYYPSSFKSQNPSDLLGQLRISEVMQETLQGCSSLEVDVTGR